MAVSFDPDVALLVMPIPTVIAVLVTVKTMQVRRAASWVEGRARIVTSQSKRESHRFQGSATTVTNRAHVVYEFHVGGETIRGERISIGEEPADGVAAALKRYPVGAEVPVFHDPLNPRDCVLERDAPVTMGCLWTGVAILLGLGIALTIAISSGESIDAWLTRTLPNVHRPLMTACVAAMGMACLAMYWAGRRRSARAAAWIVVPGKIVVSTTETVSGPSGGNAKPTRLYRARVEYAYEVDGHAYRGTRVRLLVETATSSESRARAEADRHPVGAVVDVHYDPDDPTDAVLDPSAIGGGLLIAVATLLFVVAFLVATYA